MRKINKTLFFLVAFVINLMSQTTDEPRTPKLVLNIEASSWVLLGGVSFNSEVLVLHSKKYNFLVYARAGYFKGYYFNDLFDSGYRNGLQGGFTFLQKIGNHYFESNLGLYQLDKYRSCGVSNEHKLVDENKIYPLIRFGYRYQHPNDNWMITIKLGFMGLGVGAGFAF
ncbi:MAG: hypothetical protein AAGA77_21015 [Bacteroidota bacterium]